MNKVLFQAIDRFAHRTVLVIGEAMLDCYLAGTTNRLCPEAPVPVVAIGSRTYAAGGAANTAVNVARLGGHVTLLSAIGDDAEGHALLNVLDDHQVGTVDTFQVSGRRTLSKTRVIAGEHMMVRFDEGDTEALTGDAERHLIDRLMRLYPTHDAIVVSDYNYGILTPRVIAALDLLQARYPRLMVVDSKRLPSYKDANVAAIKPNYGEAIKLLGLRELHGDERVAQIEGQGDQLLDMTGARIAVVTMDVNGAWVFERNCPPYRTYARPASHMRAAGAGDTFIGALTLTLAAGEETTTAVELASLAASLVVSKDGTAHCTAQELRGFLAADNKHLADVDELVARVAFYREQGKRIVFTNGCFDILHRGHTAYLNRAKELGDVLIVGVNNDEGIRRLKGPERPINHLEDRLEVLASLSCVDHLVAFGEDTPAQLIRTIQPDVFVKGGDYSEATLPEASLVCALGGHVEILPYLEHHSTTNMIERIRSHGTDEWPRIPTVPAMVEERP